MIRVSARVRLCVPCVSRLPPVSFYRSRLAAPPVSFYRFFLPVPVQYRYRYSTVVRKSKLYFLS